MIQLRMEDLRFRVFFPFFIIWLYPDRGHVGFLELAPAKLAELTSCPALEITSLIKNTITVKILYGLKVSQFYQVSSCLQPTYQLY